MIKEVIGIIATIFVLISFTKTNIKQIRLYNIIGALLFVIYGILINSFSTYILNSILIGIQINQLKKLKVTASNEPSTQVEVMR